MNQTKWKTKDGVELFAHEMETNHLRNVVNHAYNNGYFHIPFIKVGLAELHDRKVLDLETFKNLKEEHLECEHQHELELLMVEIQHDDWGCRDY